MNKFVIQGESFGTVVYLESEGCGRNWTADLNKAKIFRSRERAENYLELTGGSIARRVVEAVDASICPVCGQWAGNYSCDQCAPV
jgi:hypothetical protein